MSVFDSVVNQILLYIISTDSQEYYDMARERFSLIDKEILFENKEKYDLVLEIEDYNEFKIKYLGLKIK